ncbi:hypothetical protein BDF20DRAFT_835165 [Mycotypha africana]|uniref:uncharacterized protein n=1 Tax=Mycotypha africana TaxID=64632 RepID=UPI0023018285|nr:uncharacterized protein BDF20DRAFT_835165 [Mycotypha africana]KAI8979106.1 hypothetical protein BDF20DRAFT_835165 [Mycotypha africana]
MAKEETTKKGYIWAHEQREKWDEITVEKLTLLEDILKVHLKWFDQHSTPNDLIHWKRPTRSVQALASEPTSVITKRQSNVQPKATTYATTRKTDRLERDIDSTDAITIIEKDSSVGSSQTTHKDAKVYSIDSVVTVRTPPSVRPSITLDTSVTSVHHKAHPKKQTHTMEQGTSDIKGRGSHSGPIQRDDAKDQQEEEDDEEFDEQEDEIEIVVSKRFAQQQKQQQQPTYANITAAKKTATTHLNGVPPTGSNATSTSSNGSLSAPVTNVIQRKQSLAEETDSQQKHTERISEHNSRDNKYDDTNNNDIVISDALPEPPLKRSKLLSLSNKPFSSSTTAAATTATRSTTTSTTTTAIHPQEMTTQQPLDKSLQKEKNPPSSSTIPSWAQNPDLRRQLELQFSTMDPDEIFGRLPPFQEQEIFHNDRIIEIPKKAPEAF